MFQAAHPHLDLIDELVRILGWPALFGVIAWVIRKYDAGQAEFKKLGENTALAVQGITQVKQQVDTLETNHIAHLQIGINAVAKSNDQAVEVLREINKGIGIVLDRVPR